MSDILGICIYNGIFWEIRKSEYESETELICSVLTSTLMHVFIGRARRCRSPPPAGPGRYPSPDMEEIVSDKLITRVKMAGPAQRP